MTLRVGLDISGDSDDAQRAVAELDQKLDASEDAFKRQEAAARGAAGAVTQAGAAARGVGGAFRQGGAEAGGAIQLNTAQLSNMQFQLQDIAVGLASGQSPFTVIAQQGSQLVQIFGPRAGVMAALRAFGTGITTFVTNPLNIALLSVALAGGAIQILANRFLAGAAAAEDEAEKVTTLKEAIEELDRVTGRANKTHEERLRLAETTARRLLEEEIATRRLIQAQLDSALLDAELQASGRARDLTPDAVISTRGRIDSLTAQLREQEEAIASAEASLRGAVADRLNTSVEGELDPTAEITQRYAAAEAALRSEFEQGGVSAETYRARLVELRQARENDLEAAREAQTEQRNVGREYDAGRRSVENLLATQRTELAVSREVDPVKRELIRLSSEYAAATSAERLEIEQNIIALRAETAARQEAEAAQRAQDRAAGVIGGLETELELLREADPVQRELIRLREELAGATAAQRDEIIALVGAVEEERAAQENANEARRAAGAGYDYLSRSAAGALNAIIVGGRSAGDVMKNLAVQIAAAAAQALILGQGPFAQFGGGGLGGQRGGGGGFGGLIGLLFGGGRERGGGVDRGKYYLVGERGPRSLAA